MRALLALALLASLAAPPVSGGSTTDPARDELTHVRDQSLRDVCHDPALDIREATATTHGDNVTLTFLATGLRLAPTCNEGALKTYHRRLDESIIWEGNAPGIQIFAFGTLDECKLLLGNATHSTFLLCEHSVSGDALSYEVPTSGIWQRHTNPPVDEPWTIVGKTITWTLGTHAELDATATGRSVAIAAISDEAAPIDVTV